MKEKKNERRESDSCALEREKKRERERRRRPFGFGACMHASRAALARGPRTTNETSNEAALPEIIQRNHCTSKKKRLREEREEERRERETCY